MDIMNMAGRSECIRQAALTGRAVLWGIPEGRKAQQENAAITATAARMGLIGKIRTKILLMVAEGEIPQKVIVIYRGEL